MLQKANIFLQSQLVNFSSNGGHFMRVKEATENYLEICISLSSLDPSVPSQLVASVKQVLFIMKGSDLRDMDIFTEVIESYSETVQLWERAKEDERQKHQM